MKTKKIFTMFLFISFALITVEAWAGPLVWGPKKYVRDTGKPYTVTDTFTIENTKIKYWLRVDNGEAVQKPGAEIGVVEMKNMVSSAVIWVNGEKVVTTDDFNQKVYAITKDITLSSNNTIEVEVRGEPGSFIEVEIRKAELNETVSNKEGSMNGTNMKDIIHITWGYTEGASEYVIYKAYSIDGPWTEWTRFSEDQHKNAVDGTLETQTKDLCYKIEVLDNKGKVIRRYEPICVPKWQEESSLPLTLNKTPSDTIISRLFDENIYSLPSSPIWGEGKSEGIFLGQRFGKTCSGGRDSPSFQVAELSLADRFQLTDASTPLFSNPALFLEPSSFQLASSTSNQSSTQSSSQSYNGMCLTDNEFEDYDSMDASEIWKFLKDKKSFLSTSIEDVNGDLIVPYQIIYDAAQTSHINPQVILSILQREHSAVTTKDRPNDIILKHIMEYGKPSTISDQILDAAAQMRRDFDRLSRGEPTASGWQVNVTKNAIDGSKLPVTPTNKAVAVSFTYDPEVGYGWDKTSTAGGNFVFCKVWDQWNFGTSCPETSATITISGSDAPSDGSQYTASGGTAPYTWSITKGSITPDSSDSSKATVSNISSQCGAATITATDSCGNEATKDVRLPNGVWVFVNQVTFCAPSYGFESTSCCGCQYYTPSYDPQGSYTIFTSSTTKSDYYLRGYYTAAGPYAPCPSSLPPNYIQCSPDPDGTGITVGCSKVCGYGYIVINTYKNLYEYRCP